VTTASRPLPFRFEPAGRFHHVPFTAVNASGKVLPPAAHAETDLDGDEIRRKRSRILVVDDETGFRRSLCALLKAVYKAVTVEAQDAGEALEKLRAQPDIQIVLLDVQMPGMDGMTLCEQLRATGFGSCIVMMSADDSDRNRDRARELGVAFLAKPVADDELREVLLECGRGGIR
jgi:two-component system, chemotaxis family, chemotaxis protein CheY